MRTSTSRHSTVKHSTGNHDTVDRKAGRGHRRPRTSTGEEATVKHFTGRSFGPRRQEEHQTATRTKAAARKAANRPKSPQAA